jgi:hypothetical protein
MNRNHHQTYQILRNNLASYTKYFPGVKVNLNRAVECVLFLGVAVEKRKLRYGSIKKSADCISSCKGKIV